MDIRLTYRSNRTGLRSLWGTGGDVVGCGLWVVEVDGGGGGWRRRGVEWNCCRNHHVGQTSDVGQTRTYPALAWESVSQSVQSAHELISHDIMSGNHYCHTVIIVIVVIIVTTTTIVLPLTIPSSSTRISLSKYLSMRTGGK